MQCLTKEYILLFNAISDANKELESLQQRLRFAQEQAEEIYIDYCGNDDSSGDPDGY